MFWMLQQEITRPVQVVILVALQHAMLALLAWEQG
jgi:hypothetical protein